MNAPTPETRPAYTAYLVAGDKFLRYDGLVAEVVRGEIIGVNRWVYVRLVGMPDTDYSMIVHCADTTETVQRLTDPNAEIVQRLTN